jgi:hypothetical protein
MSASNASWSAIRNIELCGSGEEIAITRFHLDGRGRALRQEAKVKICPECTKCHDYIWIGLDVPELDESISRV